MEFLNVRTVAAAIDHGKILRFADRGQHGMPEVARIVHALAWCSDEGMRFARTVLGKGNGTGDGTEGAYNDTVFGTYMHCPVMARNPQIADLLLKLALDVNALPPTDDRWYEALRAERIAAATQPA